MKALALVLFAAIVAANCPHKHDWKSLEGHTSERDITIGSQNQTNLLHIPQGFSRTKDKLGFIFSYHEESKNAYCQERISGFSDRALNNKYMAVYPQAMNRTWYLSRSSGGNYSDDLTMDPHHHIYSSSILDEVYATRGLCLDSIHAYATGLGNGSSFIYHLSCYNVHNPPFQAFAGVTRIPQILDMSPDRYFHASFKPLLMIHGTDDSERTKLMTSDGTTLPNLTKHSLAAAWAHAGGSPNDQSPIISIEASKGLKFKWTKQYRLPKNPEAAVKGGP